MVPVNRILKKNLWCDSDEQFISDIAETFNLWIHRVENPHSASSAALIVLPRFVDKYTNVSNESSPFLDRESNDRGNEYNADSGKQNFSFHEIGSCSNLEGNREANACSIPKILNFIWLGSEIPHQYVILMNTWKQSHASWDVKLWTDEGETRSQLSL